MQFINPYHFISLSNKPNRQKLEEYDAVQEEKLTGSITYTLTTKSPLFIPNTTSERAFAYTPNPEDDKENEHKLYDFFSYTTLESGKTYDDEYFEPVIPGSEVRGMIRTIYETLTNSCLSITDGEKNIAKRTVEQFQPGVLEYVGNQIVLYSAEDILCRERKDFSVKYYRIGDKIKNIPEGSQILFTARRFGTNKYAKRDIETIDEHGKEKGYLLKGTDGPSIGLSIDARSRANNCNEKKCVNYRNGSCLGLQGGVNIEHCYLAEKHCAHVFKAKTIVKNNVDKITIEKFDAVIQQYLKENPDSYKEYNIAFKNFKSRKQDGLPVYYSIVAGHIMLSPACITREVYDTVSDYVQDYKACGKIKDVSSSICPACQLFGIMGKQFSKGSKIRFTDLRLKNRNQYNNVYDSLQTLDELASPKPSNSEFYLQRPIRELRDPNGDQVWFWTYDYYTVKKNNGQIIVRPYQETPYISGRKFYWNNLFKISSCDKKTKRNKTVRPVKAEVQFIGKIYFDDITDKQLKQLLFILQYTSDGKHGFKLGTGKPLGLGSVELKLDSDHAVQIRNFINDKYVNKNYNRQNYVLQSENYDQFYTQLKFDENVKAAFDYMTHYFTKREEEMIRYPLCSENGEGYEWFMRNKIYHKLKSPNSPDRNQNRILPGTTSSPGRRLQTEIKETLPDITSGESPVMGIEIRNNHAVRRQNDGTETPSNHGNV